MRNTWKYGLVALLAGAIVGCGNPNPAGGGGGTTGTTAGGATTTTTTTGGVTTKQTPAAAVTPTASSSPSTDSTPTANATPTASGTPGATTASKGEPIKHELVPLRGKDAPILTKKTTLTMTTTEGEIVIEVYPEAAPNAAKRFVELAESGFYNDTPISRVVPRFVAQFGVNWRDPHIQWKEKKFDDDPSLFSLDRGTLAFAKAGPNTNSTQVFINFTENNRLVAQNFTTFGKIVKGMDVVDKFRNVGDPSGGLDQGRLWADGGNFIDSLDVKPTMIETLVVEK